MSVESKTVGQAAVITVLGKVLDAYTAKPFHMESTKLCEQGIKHIVIDLSNVNFIDSAGIGVILTLYKTIGPDGNLVLCGVSKQVDSILTIIRLKHLLPIYDSVEGALAAKPRV